jgi:hypothetical protein
MKRFDKYIRGNRQSQFSPQNKKLLPFALRCAILPLAVKIRGPAPQDLKVGETPPESFRDPYMGH